MIRITALCAAFFAATVPAGVPAQDLGHIVRAELLTGWRTAADGHMAAIRLTLAPGWKTYWRAPGDAGIPPRFDWEGSENLAAFAPHWPVPEVFDQNGMRGVGYRDAVTVPATFTPVDPGAPILLRGEMQIGVCRDICVPVTLALGTQLPVSGQGAASGAIRAALADRPMTEAEAGVGAVVCTVEPISDGLRVTVVAELPAVAAVEESVIELPDPAIWVSVPETTRSGARLTAVAEMVPPDARPFALSRADLRLTVLGEGRAVDIRGCTGG